MAGLIDGLDIYYPAGVEMWDRAEDLRGASEWYRAEEVLLLLRLGGHVSIPKVLLETKQHRVCMENNDDGSVSLWVVK